MKTESGRSMVEIIGVMALMGLITAAAFVLIKSTNASQKRTIVIDDVAKIVTGVRTLYADYDDMHDVNTGNSDNILAAIGVDKDAPYSGTTYQIYGARKTDGTACSSNGACEFFSVKILGLPADECQVFAARAWSESEGISSSCDGTTKSVTITYAK